MSTPSPVAGPPPSPPRAVAVSGIVFSALFIASLVLVRMAVPADPTEPGAWIAETSLRSGVRFAINLIPFTGIAFLWFMAVLRHRIGIHEDQFFATVFLGSGLLFVAMLFVTAAVTMGLQSAFSIESRMPASSETYAVGRAVAYAIMNIFAVKMAAVFTFVVSTIGLRAAILPRWMAYVGYVLGLVMLLTITSFAWIALLFPLWVLLLSTYFLVVGDERVAGTPPSSVSS